MYAAVESGEESQQEPPGLSSVILEPLPEKEVPITDPFLDLREVYLRELFVPNRFSAHTLRKALGVSKNFCISLMNKILQYCFMVFEKNIVLFVLKNSFLHSFSDLQAQH